MSQERKGRAIIGGQEVDITIGSFEIEVDPDLPALVRGTKVELLCPSGNHQFDATYIVIKILGKGKYKLGFNLNGRENK